MDFKSISRAVKGVITGDSSAGGGSTITQQLIKNNVFSGGNEKGFMLYERKFQEWYIALRLENQPGKSKEDIKKKIITDYLNTINLGNNTLGVKVAAERYFGKKLNELDLAECSVLASITKNPSRLNPLTHPEAVSYTHLDVYKRQAMIWLQQQEARSQTMQCLRQQAAISLGWSLYWYSKKEGLQSARVILYLISLWVPTSDL